MSIITAAKSRVQNVATPQKKVSHLPVSAQLSVKPGLDWVLKKRLTSVIVYALLGAAPTKQSVEDLSRLDKIISAAGRRDIDQVTLYGYELATLYSFLFEQARHYAHWSAEYVPARATRIIEADLRRLLLELHALCRRIDVYADRPIHDPNR